MTYDFMDPGNNISIRLLTAGNRVSESQEKTVGVIVCVCLGLSSRHDKASHRFINNCTYVMTFY